MMPVYAVDLETFEGEDWDTAYYHAADAVDAGEMALDEHDHELRIANIRRIS